MYSTHTDWRAFAEHCHRRYKFFYSLSRVPLGMLALGALAVALYGFLGGGLSDLAQMMAIFGFVGAFILSALIVAQLKDRADALMQKAAAASPEANWTLNSFERIRNIRPLRLLLHREGPTGREFADFTVHYPEQMYDHLLRPDVMLVARVTPAMEGVQWGEVDWRASHELQRHQQAALPQAIDTRHLTCSSCGAQLPPVATRATVVCSFCNTENHVVRR